MQPASAYYISLTLAKKLLHREHRVLFFFTLFCNIKGRNVEKLGSRGSQNSEPTVPEVEKKMTELLRHPTEENCFDQSKTNATVCTVVAEGR